MANPRASSPPPLAMTAMLCSAAVTAQFVGGKAARDALFLSQFDVTALPAMVVATSVFSIGLVALSSSVLRRRSPSSFVPAAFGASAAMLLAGWGLTAVAPAIAAPFVYLQISGAGPILGSAFWLIATESFDPHTAKQRFGQIAGAGTLGGLAGGLIAERVAVVFGVAAVLPVLALLNIYCAWQTRTLARSLDAQGLTPPADLAPELAMAPARSGLRVLTTTPYLRHLAGLVLLGTIGAALVDYVFKAQAVGALGRGESLLRFFAIYYAAVSMITFVIQTSASRVALEKLGLAATTSTPSLALLAGSVGGLIAPGLQGAMVARGAESVFRGSLFRAGYELFYTPIPAHEKRAAKSIIDVAFDRCGDAVGAGVIQLAFLLPLAQRHPAILALAAGCAIGAVIVASRLNRGYIRTLERSLLNRAVELELSDVEDMTTRTTMLRLLPPAQLRAASAASQARLEDDEPWARTASHVMRSLDADMLQIMALRSRDRERILRVLRSDDGIPGVLVPHVIPLLAWDPIARDAIHALRRVAEEHIGQLVDALIDPNQDFAIRRRLPRVFTVCVSQRATDGLLLGLEDLRFEVRFHCARAVTAIQQKNPRVRINAEHIFEIVRREAAVGRPVWESQRLLARPEDDEQNVFVDDFIRDRASRSLAHVFTLLALVLPAEPLQIAFRGLHTDDQNLRGTALEYLEGVLPRAIRDALWPFLEDGRPANRSGRPREEIVADLLRSHHSILVNLDELKRRAGTRGRHPGEAKEPWQTV